MGALTAALYLTLQPPALASEVTLHAELLEHLKLTS